MSGTWLRLHVLLALLSGTAGIAPAQEFKLAPSLEKAHEALKSRDFTSAMNALKVENSTTPGYATLSAIAHGMACQKESTDGQPADHNPDCIQSKNFFLAVLHEDKSSALALEWLGALTYCELTGPNDGGFSKLKESRDYFSRFAAAEPRDPDGPYWIGVTAWLYGQWYELSMRRHYNETHATPISYDAPLSEPLRAEIAKAESPILDDGIARMEKIVIANRDKDMYATAYLALLYRQRSHIGSTPAARTADDKKADELVKRAAKVAKAGATSADLALHPQRVPPPTAPPPVAN